MKFGSNDLKKRYDFHHTDHECDGTWEVCNVDTPYSVDTGMAVMIKNAPMVKCNKCGATYFQEGFEEKFLKEFSTRLVTSKRPLYKQEIRFLRSFAGLTQDQTSKELGVSSTDISKYESTTAQKERNMSNGLMVQFKLLIAGKLGIVIPPELSLWKVETVSTAPLPQNVFDASEVG